MKNRSYNIFRQRIHKSAEEKKLPLRVMFELTYRCNFSCRHCYVPLSYKDKNGKGELKTQEIFSLLNQLKDMGCFYLGFTGGEPFIREDIMEILWYAKRCGFELIIYTNGSLINGKIAGQLARLRPNKVDITIPAMSKDAFERISGVPGSRGRVFRAIDLLHKKGVNLGFKTCVLKENAEEIKGIQAFASSLGARHRLDDMLCPRLDRSKEPYRYRGEMTDGIPLRQGYGGQGGQPALRSLGEAGRSEACPPKSGTAGRRRVRRKREFIDCDLEGNRRTPNTDKLFKCGVGISQAALTPSGELKMCVMIDYPKYKIRTPDPACGGTTDVRPRDKGKEMSLKEAWQKLRTRVKSIKPDKNYRCNKCELEPYCKWCPAKGWLEDGKFTSCDAEDRRWAEIRKKSHGNRG